MRTHLGCIGRVNLGSMGEESRNRLEQVGAAWLEFAGDGASLVVRNAQSSDTSVLSNVASELLEFLSKLADAERAKVPGGELHCAVGDTGQYVRLKVSPGAFLTVAWAQPDYSRALGAPSRRAHSGCIRRLPTPERRGSL